MKLHNAVACERDIVGGEDGFESAVTKLATGEKRAIAKVGKDVGEWRG